MGIFSLQQQERGLGALVVVLALAVAAVSARPYAASFNDGSRLATVECLVDHHTLAIDNSIFCNPPQTPAPGQPLPYPLDVPTLPEQGTLDKLFIHGHFYSDKPPLPAVLMAGFYKVLQTTTGLRAADRPDLFCFALTLASSGLAYVVAVWCVFRLGAALGLSPGLRLGLTASFALSTIALPYIRHVNSHIVQLALAAAVLLGLVRWAEDRERGRRRPLLLLGIGLLAGFAYSVEQAAGGLLALGTVLVVAYHEGVFRRWWTKEGRSSFAFPWATVLVGLGILPVALAHQALVYSFAHTLRPANTLPEYFDYPGSVFTPKDMTGRFNHDSLAWLFAYAGGLLLGERGIIQCDLPLFLLLPAALVLVRRPRYRRAEVTFAIGWCVSTWLVYALLSTNFSGECCSIRWFVPLLAPAFFLLAPLVRDSRAFRLDFTVLSIWGAVLGGLMWYAGPWSSEVPYFWPVQGAALATWLATSRLLPTRLDQLALRLMHLGWPLLIVSSILPLLFEPRPLDFLVSDRIEVVRGGQACLCLLLGLIVGLRARADRCAGSAEAWTTLAFAALAALLTALHYLLVDNDPVRWEWQREMYLSLLNHTAGAPHQYRPLPYGFVRLLEWATHDYLFATLAYRWFFCFWLAWAWYRFVRLFHGPGLARASLLVLLIYYPVSILLYYGQLTDPLSHTLLVLGLISIVQDRPGLLALALALGIPCKETAVLLVPVYLACHWCQGRRALEVTALLSGVAVAAFLAVRLPLGWRPGLEAINGVSQLMIGTNLGIGTPAAGTSVPLWVNYLHPLLFVVPFIPFALWHWTQIDPRLRTMALTLTPLLLASNLCFGWMYESRNYVPLLPVLAALALPPGAASSVPQRDRKERQAIGA